MKRIVLTLTALAFALAGCANNAGNGSGGNADAPASNDADVEFLQGMIPHHEQAIDMAGMAVEQAESEQVKQLASRIQDAQGPEIEQMRQMLQSIGAEETSMEGDMDSMGGGMMSEEEMVELSEAQGAEFDTMFLEMMIRHHESAVEMAEQELAEGEMEEAKALAQEIVDAQEAEIEEMRGLLEA